eukprot:CAMPEP_0117501724 /NCGR_PEP_ID=MMETSP0784-20121206/23447_1 /TAXON_ID=39447 /ORGANISM="" /LENGTH=205 /DNA_ID=CAMNT_0005296989 /DNA_START=122 /DNA_END=739 /DNA_ORIENTATION=-
MALALAVWAARGMTNTPSTPPPGEVERTELDDLEDCLTGGEGEESGDQQDEAIRDRVSTYLSNCTIDKKTNKNLKDEVHEEMQRMKPSKVLLLQNREIDALMDRFINWVTRRDRVTHSSAKKHVMKRAGIDPKCGKVKPEALLLLDKVLTHCFTFNPPTLESQNEMYDWVRNHVQYPWDPGPEDGKEVYVKRPFIEGGILLNKMM